MRQRGYLETFYQRALTDAQRAAWNVVMDNVPPTDASGTQYIASTPTLWNQVQCSRPTQFAWQWSFAHFYFKAEPTAAPPSDPDPGLVFSDVAASASDVQLTVDTYGHTERLWGVLFYTTPSVGPFISNPTHNARSTAMWTPDHFPRRLSIADAMRETYGSIGTGRFWLVAWAVTLQGILSRNSAYVLVTPA